MAKRKPAATSMAKIASGILGDRSYIASAERAAKILVQTHTPLKKTRRLNKSVR